MKRLALNISLKLALHSPPLAQFASVSAFNLPVLTSTPIGHACELSLPGDAGHSKDDEVNRHLSNRKKSRGKEVAAFHL